MFGGGAKKPTPKAKAATPPKAKAAAKPKAKAAGNNFFGAKPKAAPAAGNIPVVSRFRQNQNGSITGIVTNSKNFRNGTEITTSPVKRGAKVGDVVVTSSGSKYKLE